MPVATGTVDEDIQVGKVVDLADFFVEVLGASYPYLGGAYGSATTASPFFAPTRLALQQQQRQKNMNR